MKPRGFLLAVWLVIQLLAGQQLALAHMIGHLGEIVQARAAVTELVANDGDEDQGAAHTLAHVCTTCVSCLGFDAMSASASLPGAIPMAWAREVAAIVPPAPTFHRIVPFLSRAPPLLQV